MSRISSGTICALAAGLLAGTLFFLGTQRTLEGMAHPEFDHKGVVQTTPRIYKDLFGYERGYAISVSGLEKPVYALFENWDSTVKLGSEVDLTLKQTNPIFSDGEYIASSVDDHIDRPAPQLSAEQRKLLKSAVH